MLTLNQMTEMTNIELDAAFVSYGIRVDLLKKSSEEKAAMSDVSLEEYLTFLTELKICRTKLDPKNRGRIEERRANLAQKAAERSEGMIDTIILDGITVGKPW